MQLEGRAKKVKQERPNSPDERPIIPTGADYKHEGKIMGCPEKYAKDPELPRMLSMWHFEAEDRATSEERRKELKELIKNCSDRDLISEFWGKQRPSSYTKTDKNDGREGPLYCGLPTGKREAWYHHESHSDLHLGLHPKQGGEKMKASEFADLPKVPSNSCAMM